MPVLFSIGTFLTNYDVTNLKAVEGSNILHCTKRKNLRPE